MKKIQNIAVIILTVFAAVCFFSACTIESSYIDAIKDKMADDPGGGSGGTGTYTVTYDGNGNTAGDAPSDSTQYAEGDTVTVLPKPDALVLEHSLQQTIDIVSFIFEGWNTGGSGNGTAYDANDTFEMGTEDVVLYAQWTAIGAVGPGGGRIFYDKGLVSSEWRFMEAAPEDEEWWYKPWHDSSYEVFSFQYNEIGDGKFNTDMIVAQFGEGNYAASLCSSSNKGGYTDWFLPSRDELIKMYENLKNYGGWGGNYWSSSEYDASRAYGVHFYLGTGGGDWYILTKSFTEYDTNFPMYVRAARRFY
jgi:uncharacterized repeat protein (TIGR02543 family)